MGSCSSLIRPQQAYNVDLHSYPRNCTVLVRKDSNSLEKTSIDFILPESIQLTHRNMKIQSLELIITSCILPGVDPKGKLRLDCKDSNLILRSYNSIFLALFDGHGQEGARVSSFCNVYAQQYYFAYWNEDIVIPIQIPEEFLMELTLSCDKSLCEYTGNVDASRSGR